MGGQDNRLHQSFLTCIDEISSSEYTAIDLILSSLQALITRRAISPLFDIRMLDIFFTITNYLL